MSDHCPDCGSEDHHGCRVRCTTCKGNGRVEMLEHCPTCDGSGTVPDGHHGEQWTR